MRHVRQIASTRKRKQAVIETAKEKLDVTKKEVKIVKKKKKSKKEEKETPKQVTGHCQTYEYLASDKRSVP